MKKQKRLGRVDIQAFILTAVMVVLSCILIFAINYTFSYNDMIDSLQDRARGIYDYLEDNLDEDSFQSLNTKGDMQDEEYLKMKEMFNNIKSVTGVRYLYTAKLNDAGEYIYLVDGLPSESEDFRNVGDLIEPEIIPDIEKAYRGEIVLPEQIKDTSWGNIFISYFPIHAGTGSDAGSIVGVVGLEFDAEHQYQTFRWLALATPIIIILCCVISGIIAAILFKRISNPAYRDLANTDMLTGLNNRNSFDVMFHNLEALPNKEGIGLIVMDLDGLKRINDSLGHAAGDEYIRAGSSLAQRFIRPPDVLYRIGGDEFAAFVRGSDLDGLNALAESIEEASADCTTKGGVPVRMSIGCAVFGTQSDATLADVMRRADQAMYRMKKMKKKQKK